MREVLVGWRGPGRRSSLSLSMVAIGQTAR
jgi:hypothetical protein